MRIAPEDVAAVRALNDLCFACGLGNRSGLRIESFVEEGPDVVAEFTPGSDHGGTVGSVHGGITAAALDELLVWAAILQEHTLAVTATLELRYRRPAVLGESYELRGRVDERSGRRMRISGEMLHEGRPVVTAQGLYVASDSVDTLVERAYQQPG